MVTGERKYTQAQVTRHILGLKCSSDEVGSQIKVEFHIRDAMRLSLRAGIFKDSPSYLRLQAALGNYKARIGFKIPSPVTFILRLAGLSPGEITVWHHGESGWFTEARAKPGAAPVYHHVSDDMAVALLKGELTHELELKLMKPDEYIGE